MSVVNLGMEVYGLWRLPAKRSSLLDEYLGYPCYAFHSQWLTEGSTHVLGNSIRLYFALATTAIVLITAIATLYLRYRGGQGRLVQVIQRDGGAYCLTIAAVMSLTGINEGPAASGFNFLIPILAQRLLINLRKAVNMGTWSYASSLLFKPATPDPNGAFPDNHNSQLTERMPVDLDATEVRESQDTRMRASS
ncbi:hypothetical protein FA13DRAFT_1738907, partial [Coprinellus micaceus]